MAASITVGSLSLAANGLTLTGTLAGGTGTGYAITNANGLLPHLSSGTGGTYIIPTATPSIVGTTITITLPSPFLSGQTVQLSVNVLNTITDSGGNTGTTSPNMAVTNNSTVVGSVVNYQSSIASIIVNGAARLDSNGINSGYTSNRSAAGGGAYTVEYVVEVTSGTIDLHLECQRAAALTIGYSVDGAANSTLGASSLGAYEVKTLATGLGVGRHIVRHDVISNYFCKGVWFTGSTSASIISTACPVTAFVDSVTGYTVQTGTSPAKRWGTQKNTQFVGTFYYVNNIGTGSAIHPGFQFNVGVNATGLDVVCQSASATRVLGADYASFAVAIDPATANTSSYTHTSYATNSTVGNSQQVLPIAVGMSSGAHAVEAIDVSTGLIYCLRAYNGSKLTSAASAGAGTIAVADITHIADGDWLCLGHAQNDEVVKVSSHSGSGPYTLTLASNLALAHASGEAVRAYTPATAPTFSDGTLPTFIGRIVSIGDSICKALSITTAGTSPASDHNANWMDPRASHSYMAAKYLGYEWVDAAVESWTSATLVTNNGANNFDLRKPATIYEIEAGTNDFINQNVTTATYQSNLEALIGQCKTAAPSGATIVVQKVFSNTQTAGAAGKTKADFNAAQLTAIANTAASGYTIRQVDYAALLTKTAAHADIPDNIHPSWTTGETAGTGGQNKMAAAMVNDLVDSTAPTVTAKSINSLGTTLSLTFSESVTGVSASDYALSGGHTLSSATGTGTAWSMTISAAVNDAETITLTYTGTATKDASNNLLATFSGSAVTNNSTVDATAPGVPGSVAVLAGNTIAKASWTASSGGDVAGYQYRIDGGSAVDVGNVLFKYFDTTNASHTFEVRAYDEVPNYSAYCSAVTFTPSAGGGGSSLFQSSLLRIR